LFGFLILIKNLTIAADSKDEIPGSSKVLAPIGFKV
jgi:hypothetical protein